MVSISSLKFVSHVSYTARLFTIQLYSLHSLFPFCCRQLRDFCQNAIQDCTGFVDLFLLQIQRWNHAQRIGGCTVEQQTMFQRFLHNHGGEAMLDVYGSHEAPSAWAVDELILRA